MEDVWALALRAQRAYHEAASADLELRRNVLALAGAGMPRKLLASTVQPHLDLGQVHGILRGAELLHTLSAHLPGEPHLDRYPLLEQGHWRLRALESGRVEIRLHHHNPHAPGDELTMPGRQGYVFRALRQLRARVEADWAPDSNEGLLHALVGYEPVHAEIRRSYKGRCRPD